MSRAHNPNYGVSQIGHPGAADGCRLTGRRHPRAPVELPDGSVIVPAHLAGPVRRILVRDLAQHVRTDGGTPTAGVRQLVYALSRAEHHHDHAAAMSATGPISAPSPTLEISTAEAAQLMGCTDRHVRRLCRSGVFTARQVGRAWLIDQAAFDTWRYATEAA